MNRWRVVFVSALLAVLAPVYAWVARYNGPANGPDRAVGIAADLTGNVYVTGSSAGSGSGPDFVTVKYNPAGETVWVRRLSSSGSVPDRAAAVVCTPYQGVYTAGYTTVGGNTDFWTVRHDPATGDTLWTRRYGGTGADQAQALAADRYGNVFAAGVGQFGSRTQAVVVSYDSAGTQQWVCRIPARSGDSSSAANAVASGPGQSAYVCGWMRAGASSVDYFAARIRSTGETAWVRTYSGNPAGYDTAYALAVDASGSVIVTGGSMGAESDYDYATLKFDSLGNLQWTARYDGPDFSDDVASSVAIDSAGYSYVTGWSTGTGSRYSDYATVRYSPTGSELWVARYHGGSGDDEAWAIGLDRAGGVYVTGSVETNSNGTDIYTIKYDTAGGQQWAARYNYTPPNRDDKALALVAPGPGVVCVTGFSYNPSTDTDFVTIRYVEQDAGVTAILAPTDTIPPLPVAPQVRIRNEGLEPETVTVVVEIYDGARRAYSASVVVPDLAPNASQDVVFPAFQDLDGQYVISCRVVLTGDMNPVNDTLSGWFYVKWRELPFWTQKANVPAGLGLKGVKDGGALCHGRYDATRFAVFALKGNNTNEFYRYHVAVDSWYPLESVPYAVEKRKRVKKGAALCYDRYDTLVFAFKGNGTSEFWRYDVIHDSWSRQADVPFGTGLKPKTVKGGSGLAFWHEGSTGHDYVYALKGNKTSEFWRYLVQADTWEIRRDVPLGTSLKGMGDGSCLVNAGGTLYALKGSYNELFAYNIGTDSWYVRASLPFENRSGRKKKAKLGTSICYLGGTIYALKGGTCEFWGYNPLADVWFELESIPRLPSSRPVKGGGALAAGSGLVWALKGNKTFEFFSYDPGADAPLRPTPEPSAQADGVGPTAVDRARLEILPNPMSNDVAVIRLPTTCAGARITVYDALGRCVQASSSPCRSSSWPLDLRVLPAGVYLVRLDADGVTATAKLVVRE
jgi:hypothetical protein